MRLSVVIPTLNAARHLPACLARLGGADELIVADGGSTDGTARLAEEAHARLIIGPAGRGAQLRAGAQAARGDWLLFLHADTVLAADWHAAVKAHWAASRRPACFRLRLDDPAWQARVIERAVAGRVRWFGLPYGDQGLLVGRRHYDSVGGYRPMPLMEDVDIVRRLGGIAMLPVDALTSAERWRRDGWARRSARNLTCLALYRAGLSPERVVRIYAGRCR